MNTDEHMTREESREHGGPGWNLRCNNCGTYGARWISKGRPGWGSLALCPFHEAKYEAELLRHKMMMRDLREISFEQDIKSAPWGPREWD